MVFYHQVKCAHTHNPAAETNRSRVTTSLAQKLCTLSGNSQPLPGTWIFMIFLHFFLVATAVWQRGISANLNTVASPRRYWDSVSKIRKAREVGLDLETRGYSSQGQSLKIRSHLVGFTFTWGNDPIWRGYFSNGLVQPPTSHLVSVFLDDWFIYTLRFKLGSWTWTEEEIPFRNHHFQLPW